MNYKLIPELEKDIKEAKAAEKTALAKKRELTKDVDKEINDAFIKRHNLELKLARIKNALRAAARRNDRIDVVLEWDNNLKFDSRIDKYWELYHKIATYGVPTKSEVKHG